MSDDKKITLNKLNAEDDAQYNVSEDTNSTAGLDGPVEAYAESDDAVTEGNESIENTLAEANVSEDAVDGSEDSTDSNDDELHALNAAMEFANLPAKERKRIEKEQAKQQAQKEMQARRDEKAAAKKAKEKAEDEALKETKAGKIRPYVLIGIGIGLAILLIIFLRLIGNRSTVDEGPVTEATPVAVNANDMLGEVTELVNNAYANGADIYTMISDELGISYVFDKNGCAYVEGPYVNGLYVDKVTSISAKDNEDGSPYWAKMEDITPLYVIEKMVSLAKDGYATIEDVSDQYEETSEDGVISVKTYNIIIEGPDIARLFEESGTNYCADKLQILYGVTNKSSIPLTDNFMISIHFPDTLDNMAVAALVNHGDKTSIDWYFDGYLSLGEWELDQSYWNKDMDLSDFDKVNDKFGVLLQDLGEILNKFFENNPEIADAILSEEESSESAEPVQVTTAPDTTAEVEDTSTEDGAADASGESTAAE